MSYRAKGWMFALTFSLGAWVAVGLIASQALHANKPVLVSSNELPQQF